MSIACDCEMDFSRKVMLKLGGSYFGLMVSFALSINGQASESYFAERASTGVPSFSILCAESLSIFFISVECLRSNLLGCKVARNAHLISHLFFCRWRSLALLTHSILLVARSRIFYRSSSMLLAVCELFQVCYIIQFLYLFGLACFH